MSVTRLSRVVGRKGCITINRKRYHHTFLEPWKGTRVYLTAQIDNRYRVISVHGALICYIGPVVG